jgi:ribosomal protein L15
MSTYTQNNKRGFTGRDSGRGRKYGRGERGGRSSFNMVATHGSSELSDVKLKLPPTREQWLTLEQQIRAVATKKKNFSQL